MWVTGASSDPLNLLQPHSSSPETEGRKLKLQVPAREQKRGGQGRWEEEGGTGKVGGGRRDREGGRGDRRGGRRDRHGGMDGGQGRWDGWGTGRKGGEVGT